MKHKELLLEALREAVNDSKAPRRLVKELGDLIISMYRERNITTEVNNIVKKRNVAPPAPAAMELAGTPISSSTTSNWEDYTPGKRKQISGVKSEDVAEPKPLSEIEPKPDPNDEDQINIKELASFESERQVLEFFGSLSKIKRYAKEIHLDIDHQQEPQSFLTDFFHKIVELAKSIPA